MLPLDGQRGGARTLLNPQLGGVTVDRTAYLKTISIPSVKFDVGMPPTVSRNQHWKVTGLTSDHWVSAVRSRQHGEVQFEDDFTGSAGISNLRGVSPDSSAQADVALGARGEGREALHVRVEEVAEDVRGQLAGGERELVLGGRRLTVG